MVLKSLPVSFLVHKHQSWFLLVYLHLKHHCGKEVVHFFLLIRTINFSVTSWVLYQLCFGPPLYFIILFISRGITNSIWYKYLNVLHTVKKVLQKYEYNIKSIMHLHKMALMKTMIKMAYVKSPSHPL